MTSILVLYLAIEGVVDAMVRDEYGLRPDAFCTREVMRYHVDWNASKPSKPCSWRIETSGV